MASLKYYGLGPRGAKALIAANFAGVSLESVPVEMGVTNKTPEYLAMCPTGKVPCLVTPEGPLFESNAICRYIANLGKSNIYPRDNFTRSQVDEWIDASMSLDSLPMYLVYNLIGYVKHDAAKEEATWKDLDKACEPLDQHLASRTFFVGDNVTLADIIIMTQFMGLWLVGFGEERRKRFPHLTRWLQTMFSHPMTLKTTKEPLPAPAKDVCYQEGAANTWGDGPNPFLPLMLIR